MPATGTDWFSCRYVRIARPAHAMSSGPVPDPTLGSKKLPRGGWFLGGHDYRFSDDVGVGALADPVHEFSDAEQLAVGKDCRSATPNPEVTSQGHVANYVKSLGTHQRFVDDVSHPALGAT
jgi:hypothetical protein